MFVALDKISRDREGSDLLALPPSVAQTSSSAYTPCCHNPAPMLGVGSMVQVSDPPLYGMLQWIGELKGAIAGVEMVSSNIQILHIC